jgi:hypothetical protein
MIELQYIISFGFIIIIGFAGLCSYLANKLHYKNHHKNKIENRFSVEGYNEK